MKAKNKWNGKLYSIIQIEDNIVELKRENGTTFKISKSEFYFAYILLGGD